MRTQCLTCKGEGYVLNEWTLVDIPRSRSDVDPVHLPCPQCDGTGWLDGIRPPV